MRNPPGKRKEEQFIGGVNVNSGTMYPKILPKTIPLNEEQRKKMSSFAARSLHRPGEDIHEHRIRGRCGRLSPTSGKFKLPKDLIADSART
jgi:hypothetical protein